MAWPTSGSAARPARTPGRGMAPRSGRHPVRSRAPLTAGRFPSQAPQQGARLPVARVGLEGAVEMGPRGATIFPSEINQGQVVVDRRRIAALVEGVVQVGQPLRI